MKRIPIYTGLISLLLFTTCVEPFDPDIGSYENALAVTGSVLEGRHISRIQLGRTFSFDESEPELVAGAKVFFKDDEGNDYQLKESEETPGIYESDTTAFQGVAGRSYQLRIETPNGNIYESEWQLMKKSAQLEDVYFEYEEDVIGFDTLDGIQIYIDASDPENSSRFYRWEFEETWHIQVPMPARASWDLQTNTFELYENEEIPHICYQTNKVNDIILRTTQGLSEDRIERMPLHYVSGQTNRLVRRYTILVKQYALTEKSYNFWSTARDLNQDVGTLFDPIPNQLIGNIQNINDPDDPVLGYFSADGYDERRIFIDRLDLPPDFKTVTEYEFCEESFFFTADALSLFIATQGGGLSGIVTDFFGNIQGFTGAKVACTDCRTKGVLEKPDFWK